MLTTEELIDAYVADVAAVRESVTEQLQRPGPQRGRAVDEPLVAYQGNPSLLNVNPALNWRMYG